MQETCKDPSARSCCRVAPDAQIVPYPSGAKIQVKQGLPFAVNANTVLYNKAKFRELGLSVPTTWNEFVAVAETCMADGQTPFYLTLKDAWTGMDYQRSYARRN